MLYSKAIQFSVENSLGMKRMGLTMWVLGEYSERAKENLDKFLHLLESAFLCSCLVVDQLWEEHLVMSLNTAHS